jgi:hypothetical protein
MDMKYNVKRNSWEGHTFAFFSTRNGMAKNYLPWNPAPPLPSQIDFLDEALTG